MGKWPQRKIRLYIYVKTPVSFNFYKIESTAKKTDSFMERKGKIALLFYIFLKGDDNFGKARKRFSDRAEKGD